MSLPTSHLRLTRRGRIVIGAALLLPATALMGSFIANASAASASGTSSSVNYRHVQVEAGQSLWQLAVVVAPSADPRDVVADIVRLNNLPSAVVQPGQSLAIPAGYRG
ncbi:MAG: LysM peptidoglycan-binding domain-containing protein [Microbacteriaceae bacterium]|nr:LysM peptidoglycan-binding domain-containing protein [Microbacteriaceae bacterium]